MKDPSEKDPVIHTQNFNLRSKTVVLLLHYTVSMITFNTSMNRATKITLQGSIKRRLPRKTQRLKKPKQPNKSSHWQLILIKGQGMTATICGYIVFSCNKIWSLHNPAAFSFFLQNNYNNSLFYSQNFVTITTFYSTLQICYRDSNFNNFLK